MDDPRRFCRPLFEVADRIPPRRHHITQQLVRFRYRTGGTVNEARLHPAPGLDEARAIGCRERPNVKPLDSLCPPFEPGFPVPPATAVLHGAGVFSATELSPQSFSPALSAPKERGDACKENDARPTIKAHSVVLTVARP